MYKYAIIGFGGLGKLHLSNLLKLEKERGDFRLKAICGAEPETFKECVKLNLGTVDIGDFDFSDCNFYKDYKDLIDNEELDFVLSTLPSFLHEEAAVYALNKGIDVFSEKPMALSLESCDRMVKAAEVNDRKLMIGQCLRFDSAYKKIKEYIDNNTFGKVYRAEFTRYSKKPTWTWNNWILDPQKSGGCVLDMHIHDVDLINWFFGKPKKMHSVMTEKKVKAESIFTQYFYDDLFVTSNADWSMTETFPFKAECLLNFEEATVVCSDGKLNVYKDNESMSVELSDDDYFMEEMRAFLRLVIDGEECRTISVESVRNSIGIALQEIKSAETEEVIAL